MGVLNYNHRPQRRNKTSRTIPQTTKQMIKELKAYTVICDNCGADQADGQEYSCWLDAGQAEDTAMDSEWQRSEDEERHYCPTCVIGVDEHTDEPIIDKTRTKK